MPPVSVESSAFSLYSSGERGRVTKTIETLQRELKQSIELMMDKGRDASVRSAISNQLRLSLAELHNQGFHVTIGMRRGRVEVELRSAEDNQESDHRRRHAGQV